MIPNMITTVYHRDATIIHFNLVNYPIISFELYIDHTFMGTFYPVFQFSVQNGCSNITISCMLSNGARYDYHIPCQNLKRQTQSEARTFQEGDVIVACDNMNGLPPGYMGHSAIVIDNENLIEAVPSHPQVRTYPIRDFLTEHPMHAQFRCTDLSTAKKAKTYAENYLKKYNENMNSGIEEPSFSFSVDIPLNDPWSSFYCSKLVWLCYYYGAGVEFKNDHYLFTPEDLSTSLEENPLFTLIYKHPNFAFKINT